MFHDRFTASLSIGRLRSNNAYGRLKTPRGASRHADRTNKEDTKIAMTED